MKFVFVFSLVLFFSQTCFSNNNSNHNYKIDEKHTFVTFEVIHFNTSTVRGRFNKKMGLIFYDKKNKQLKFDITIIPSSIDSGIPSFDKHLKSEDFLNIKQFNKIRLKSKKAIFQSEKLLSIEASLFLLGKEGLVILTPSRFGCYENPREKKEVCGGDFVFEINRSRWGMNYGIPSIPKKVRLLIQIEAINTSS